MINSENENILTTPPVDEQHIKVRLDKWLASCTDLSRSRISALIAQGAVFFNDECVCDQDRKTILNEVYEIRIPPAVPANPEAEQIELDIVYEDEDLLVINKPAGMVVHPAAGNYEGTLVNALLGYCKGSLSGIGGVIRPGIVHRLDKETSGLMVVAKNDKAHNGLSAQFSVHSLQRRYLALVWGILTPRSGVVENQIGRSPYNRKKMAVLKTGGKRAETHYQTLEIFAHQAFSLVECVLKTGRTHQVRVHMTDLGHPLIGDKVYGKVPKTAIRDEVLKPVVSFPRHALHSYKMSFIHPLSCKEMNFEIPLAQDMQTIVNSFRTQK